MWLIHQGTEEQHYSTFVRIHRLVRLASKAVFLFNLPFLFFLLQPFILPLPSQGVKTCSQIHTSRKRDHDRERRQICHPALLPSRPSHQNPAFPRIPHSLPMGAAAEKAESHHFRWHLVIPCAPAVLFEVSNQVELDQGRATKTVY